MIPTSPDILVSILDYLDSPTLMDCREISKDFLKVIDDHPYLWSYFYLPEQGKKYSHKMFKLFAAKSRNRLRGVDISVDLPSICRKAFARILLCSTRSLRFFNLAKIVVSSDWDPKDLRDLNEEEDWEDQDSDEDDYSSEEEEKEADSEEEIWGFLPDQVRRMRYIQSFKYITTGWEQKSTLKLRDSVDGKAVRGWNPENGCPLVELHLAYGYGYFRLYSLLHGSCGSLKLPDSPLLKFPNLVAFQWRGAGGPNGVLEMPKWLTESSRLRIVHFIPFFTRIVYFGSLPLSIEQFWLSDLFHRKRGDPSVASAMHLHRLVEICPKLEHLRIEGFGISEEELLYLLRTRHERFEQGVQIDGEPIQRIKKVTLYTSLFEASTLEEIKGLVDEVEDVFDAPEVMEIEC